MSGVTLRLPWPPSVGNYWGQRIIPRRNGKPFVQVYLTKRAKTFRLDVQAIVLQRFGVIRASNRRFSVAIVAHPPDRRARDIDNTLKGTLDALTHAKVWEDDEQVDHISISRGVVKRGGELIVTIEARPEPPKQGVLI